MKLIHSVLPESENLKYNFKTVFDDNGRGPILTNTSPFSILPGDGRVLGI